MITIKAVFLDPPIASGEPFEPITFEKGVNLIVGEKSSDEFSKDKKSKMNSVGKSLLVEMINFCLFKDYESSRLSKIPEKNLSNSTRVCLKLLYEDAETIKTIVIKRPIEQMDPIEISVDEIVTEFIDIEDAKKFIERYFLNDTVSIKPGFRQLLSILIRDEKYGYSSVLEPSQTSAMTPYNEKLIPHMYMFGFELDSFKKYGSVKKELTGVTSTITNLKKEFTYRDIKETDVRSYINELEGKVKRLDVALNELKPGEGIEQSKKELSELQLRLNDLISQKTSKSIFAHKIKSLPKVEKVDVKKIKEVYDNYKDGLGKLVEKNFEEVLSFRHDIEDFQNQLMSEKLIELNQEIQKLDREIENTDTRISKISESLDYKGTLSSLGDALLTHSEKSKELEVLRAAYLKLEDEKIRKAQLTLDRDKLINGIESQITSLSEVLNSFEKDLKNIHNSIAGDMHCHFRLAIDRKSLSTQFLDFDYRIDFDGGYAIDRAKIFIYDSLLMINEYTKRNHPGFLIHDNAFAGAGLDDMIKGLNYLNQQHENAKDFQYIFTINKDEYDSHIDEFNFDSEDHIRKRLTREEPLLNASYREK